MQQDFDTAVATPTTPDCKRARSIGRSIGRKVGMMASRQVDERQSGSRLAGRMAIDC